MKIRLVRIVALLLSFVFITGSATAKVVNKIEVKGLVVNNISTVLRTLSVKEGEEFTGVDIQNSIKSLYKHGDYSDVRFYFIDENEASVSIIIEVKENPVCESVEIVGSKKLKRKELEDKLTINRGFVLSDSKIHDNILILKDFYAEEGYLLAEISCDLIESKVPGNVIAKFKIKEGKKVRVRQILFTGNTVFSSRKLKRKLKTKEKKWFSTGEYKEDEYKTNLDTLLQFYYNNGYLDATLSKDSVVYEKNNKDINIYLGVSEGKRYFVGNFYFKGNSIIESDALRHRITLGVGKPFDKSKYEMTRAFIGNAYREEGYLWAQVIDDQHFRGDTVDVTFDITEGRSAVVRKITITGNEKTREKVIRRELSIFPGQKYKQSRMERSVRDVMQLKYFDNVVPDLKPGTDGNIDLLFDIQETENIGQFSAGVQYSQQSGMGGNFSISIPNFRGAGEKLDATVEFAKYHQLYSLGFSEPWILNTPTWFNIKAFYERTTYQNSDREYQSYGVEPGISRKLTWPDDYFRLYMRYRISYENNNIRGATLNGFDVISEGFLSKITATLVRNSTDVPNFPTQGTILSIEGQFAGLGGSYRYLKTVASYDWYFPVFWKFVVGARSKFGLIGGLPGLARDGKSRKRLSNEDLFAAGGVYYDGIIRGYEDGAFGRYNNSGLALLAFSSELRFPILENQLYMAGFIDGGNVWDDVADVSLSDIYAGVGFGVRLTIPMLGLLGFDFAWKLVDPNQTHLESNTYDKFKFHFLMNRGF